MSLKLVYGRIGSGKTSFCMEEAISADSNVLYIVPEQFTFSAEQRFCEKVNIHGLGGVEVLSFKRLATRVLSSMEGASLPRLDARTKVIMMQKILLEHQKDLQVLKRVDEDAGIPGALCDLFRELKRYQITPEALQNAGHSLPEHAKKLSDIALLYETYTKRIHDKFADRDDDICALSNCLLSSDFLADKEIYLDRFDGFDPSELLCIRAMLLSAKRVIATIPFLPGEQENMQFKLHKGMEEALINLAKENGVPIQKPLNLGERKSGDAALVFLEDAYFSYPTTPYTKETDAIHLAVTKNPLDEVHHAARWIVKLCRERGYLFRDIAVTARNIEMYEPYIKAAFPSYNIPFYMDRRINILQHPFTVFVLSALEIMIKGYSYDTMFRYIKSGFVRQKRETVDALENYVLATGLRGKIWEDSAKWTARMEIYGQHESEAEKEVVQEADRVRRRIMAPIIRLREALRQGETATEKCAAIYGFLEDMHAARRIRAISALLEKHGDMATAAEYRGVYNDFIEALDGVHTAFGNEKISTRRLYDILRVALIEFETATIPSALDGISIGSIDRVKGYRTKALFVLGVTDGIFPAPLTRGGIFSDEERVALSKAGVGLKHILNKTIFEEEFLIYKCITMPSEFLSLSHAAADMEGSALTPSRIFQRVSEVFPSLEIYSELVFMPSSEKISVADITMRYVMTALREGTMDETLQKAYGWLSLHRPEKMQAALESARKQTQNAHIPPELVRHFFGNDIKTSITRLEKQASCPFAHFTSHILGAQERKVFAPSNLDAGRFLHEFIDLFSKRLRENNMQWKQVDAAYIDKEFEEITPTLDARISAQLLENSPRYAYLFTRLRSAVRESVLALSAHMQKSHFEPLGYELVFDKHGDFAPITVTLPGGQKILLTGRIDRADTFFAENTNKTYVRIIDYKSGTPSFDLGEIYEGLHLQLAVYISALCSTENAPLIGENPTAAGVLYFKIDDPVIDALPSEPEEAQNAARLRKFKLSGLLLDDKDVLKAMDGDIGTSSDILPAKMTSQGPGGNVATSKQFEILSESVMHTVRRLMQEILKGDISVRPYKKDDKTPCAYCPYDGICVHDGKSFKTIEKQKPAEIWKAMEAANDAG